jgi:hypothetical protein
MINRFKIDIFYRITGMDEITTGHGTKVRLVVWQGLG